MDERRALVSGASIAGLAAAYWLERTGWSVSIIERAEAFRDGGQNVDVRGSAHEVVERMGLSATIRALTTTEVGTRFVDAHGAAVGEFPVRAGRDGPTAELEILRGDLARSVRDLLGESTSLRFGEQIESVRQGPATATVALASGAEETYDLAVVAEGVRSRTRDAVFGDGVRRRPLGLTMVYGTIERTADDDRWWNWYTATGKRQVTLRPDDVGTTRATLAYLTGKDELTGRDELTDAAPQQRQRILRRVFAGAGWQAERVLDGFERSGDVYADDLTQIRMDRWSRGRVVVLGDAAWCVTPLGGGGSSLALLGAYVLAAQLSTARGDVEAGLRRYEQWMRPVVQRTQKLPPGVPRLAYPSSRLGVRVQRASVRLASSTAVRGIAGRMLGAAAEADRQLPVLVPSSPAA